MVGIGATVTIDLWGLLLRRAFGIASLSFCLLGRWILHMPGGRFVHASIGAAAARPGECAVGWTAHYLIGMGFAVLFVLVAPAGWLERPTVGPALAFGVVTTLVPFLVLQPALGLGLASSKAARPWLARLKSLGTHAVFGLGLYLSARLLGPAW
ncbi:MAG: DUF2938 domain-containing protein [Gemmatimonadales bacterium]|nr:DUF2938 domain-containing protein [Gemmatimonadales bacterium]MBP9198959.1 DUF2938 domain-containing protein [Gemmatimonadales bacterium]